MLILCSNNNKKGYFLFPKDALIKYKILSTNNHKEGKRGFRLYPTWDSPISAQALRTQKWQGDYFHEGDFFEDSI